MCCTAKGFTLIELSIVLVILALITGALVGGSTLIESSKTSKIISDIKNIVVAGNAFHLQYNALPGDLKNATEYWGTNTNCGNTVGGTFSSGTCNGNEDGLIDIPGSYGRAQSHQEMFWLWQQFVLAELMQGQFHGNGTIHYAAVGINENIPASRFNDDVGYLIARGGNTPTGGNNFRPAGSYAGNNLDIGSIHSVGWTTYIDGPAFTPKQASMLDKKMDDGLPMQGRLVVGKISLPSGDVIWSSPSTCTTAANAWSSNATYRLSNTDVICRLVHKNIF